MTDISQAIANLIMTGKAMSGVSVGTIMAKEITDQPPVAVFRAVPDGLKVENISAEVFNNMPTPRRRRGSLILLSPTSLIEYVNRYVVQGQTVIFADTTKREITAVINYHEPSEDGIAFAEGTPRAGEVPEPVKTGPFRSTSAQWGDFRASYAFPLSRQWKTWIEFEGKPQTQADLAHFIEDNIRDIADPESLTIPANLQMMIDRLNLHVGAPARLLEVARGMEVRSNETFRQAVNTDTGEQVIAYEQAHASGGNPTVTELRVPTAFLLTVPVFQNDSPYLMLCRLRYRKVGAGVAWIINVQQADAVLEDAFARGCQQIQDGTGVTLFFSQTPGNAGG